MMRETHAQDDVHRSSGNRHPRRIAKESASIRILRSKKLELRLFDIQANIARVGRPKILGSAGSAPDVYYCAGSQCFSMGRKFAQINFLSSQVLDAVIYQRFRGDSMQNLDHFVPGVFISVKMVDIAGSFIEQRL
jgi:hypothetical protein